MNLLEYTFSGKKVTYYLDASFSFLKDIVPVNRSIVVTDETVYQACAGSLSGYKTIVIPAGEQHKNQSTVNFILDELIRMEADRQSFLVGMGGGVVTDIAGFAASVYMRGIRFGFVPTTILAQVDASIGGKNGIDAGVYKNMIGVIRQPDFILFDHSLLQTLPQAQWVNGFAEIIKHACIRDASLFELLEQKRLEDFRHDHHLLSELIARNVQIKSDVVSKDEFETGDRKLLNFGHTVGHAIENTYELLHGHAVSIGMAAACRLSVAVGGFSVAQQERVIRVLQQYGLPVHLSFDKKKVFDILKMDKKRVRDDISFILLKKIGHAVIQQVPLKELEALLESIHTYIPSKYTAMIVTIHPSAVTGSVRAPASKSSMQRACAAALLSKGQTRVMQPGRSNDDRAALDVIQKLGARVVENRDGSFTIDSTGVQPVAGEINCGESGLGIRMFTPIAALSGKEIVITGTGSLVNRPMHFFEEVLPQAGVSIGSNGGKLPLRIKGPLVPQDIEVDGSLSSQFLTGLLMAYGAAGANGVSIKVNNLTSKPYIDLTLDVMRRFGVQVAHQDYQVFHFHQTDGYQPTTYTVEGDWSGGAFLLAAGAVAGDIIVEGLDAASTQADKAMLQALKSCGARLTVEDNRISCGGAALQPFHFDATDCPDLFPPLVVLAAYCNGVTEIKGASRLTHKESNRALTLQEEFGKMGVDIELKGDLMLIHGGKPLKSTTVHSHHDHRIAMACAVAGLGAAGKTVIEEALAVNKSYPQFYQHLAALGADVQNLQSEPHNI